MNFLSYLGWSPSIDAEGETKKLSRIKLLPELCQEFRLEDVTKDAVIVDEVYLKWLNKGHFKKKLEDSEALGKMVQELKTVVGKHYQ